MLLIFFLKHYSLSFFLSLACSPATTLLNFDFYLDLIFFSYIFAYADAHNVIMIYVEVTQTDTRPYTLTLARKKLLKK